MSCFLLNVSNCTYIHTNLPLDQWQEQCRCIETFHCPHIAAEKECNSMYVYMNLNNIPTN